MSEPTEFEALVVIGCGELAKLRARAADAEREAAQEKARNAELAEQLRVARAATRDAVAVVERQTSALEKSGREIAALDAALASAKEQHLADVGTLSRCLEARDKRVAELEDRLRHPVEVTVPAGYVKESWVWKQWEAAGRYGRSVAVTEYVYPEVAQAREFERRMGWRT